MDQIISLLSHGSTHVWLFLPSAVLLGALHGLEPGHSKTMMAAFIVAVRGTVLQAALLGIAAAVSHTLVIWILAAFALYFGQHFNVESTEPWFRAGSGIIVLITAAWMGGRTWHDVEAARHHGHRHHHDHDHDHDHHHGDHDHNEEADHSHPELEIAGAEYQDAHERAHALEIERRFADRKVTTGQMVLFGLSGGLMPCPAAFTILVLCLQLKKFTIGFALVFCFSVGLALTLVCVGAAAAWSVQHAARRWSGFSNWARRAPFLSSGLLAVLGTYLLVTGLTMLLAR